MNPESIDWPRSQPVLWCLASLGLTPIIYVHLSCALWPVDDAFITFRYVDNFIAGKGLVYNDGERVFGVTTPMYVVWLSLLRVVAPQFDVVSLSIRANVIPYCFFVIAMWKTASKLGIGSAVSLLLAFVLAYHPRFITVSLSGMETFLFLALCLWSLFFALNRQWLAGGVCASLAALARPEGVFVVAATVAHCLWVDRRALKKQIVIPLVLLLWVIPSWIYYGSPIPNSVVAKAAPLYPLPFGYSFWLMMDYFERIFWLGLPSGVFGISPFIGGLLVLPLAALALRGWSGDSFRSFFPVVSSSAMILLFYVAANPLIMSWYWPIIGLNFLVLTVFGLTFLWREKKWIWNAWMQSFVGLMVIIWLVCSWTAIVPEWREFKDVARGRNDALRRVLTYRDAALWLNENRADKRVAAPEIGALGYYFRGSILDVCGLVSPEAIPYLPVPLSERKFPKDGVIGRQIVFDLAPELIVTMEIFARRSLLNSRRFFREYQLIKKFELMAPLWGSRHVLVFERRQGLGVDSKEK